MTPQRFNLKKLIVILASALIIGVALLAWLTHSLYQFSVTGSDSYSLERSTDTETAGVLSLFGYSLIPKSTDFIEVRDGTSLTRHTLTQMPWFGIQEESVTLQHQRAVDKVGMSGIGCDFTTASSDAVYSYSCTDLNSPVLTYADRQAGEHTNDHAHLTGDTFIIDRKPYRDGMLLAIVSGDNKIILQYTSPTGDVIESLELGSIDTANNIFRLFTSATTDTFVLFNTENKTTYTFSNGLRDDYEEVALSDQLNTDESVYVVDCSLTDNQTACFFAISHEHDEADSNAEHEGHTKTPTEGILVFQPADADSTSYPINHGFETICLQDGSIIALDQDSRLYYLDTTNPADTHLLDTDVRTLDCSGTTTAYTKAGSVFTVSGASSYLLFQMDRFALSNVQTQFDGSILFNTFVNGTEEKPAQNILHTYAVNEQEPVQDTSKRLEHILPYNTAGLPILDIDYDNQSVYIRPQTSIISDHQTGETIVNQDMLDVTKNEIEQQLRQDGILDRLKIVYF